VPATDTTTLSTGRLASVPPQAQDNIESSRISAHYFLGYYGTKEIEQSREEPQGAGLVCEFYNQWAEGVDLIATNAIIVASGYIKGLQITADPYVSGYIEWPTDFSMLNDTAFQLSSTFSPLSQETIEYLGEQGLYESVVWFQTAAPQYFAGANFELDLLPPEEDEGSLLVFKVFGSFDGAEFRKRRHLMCQAMLMAKHKPLYEVISIFQRGVRGCGRETISWYGTVSAE